LPQAGSERRRHRRVEVPAVAAVFSRGQRLGVFGVRDLSQGGVSIVGDALLVPSERIELLLQLPARPTLALAGRVLRRQVSSPKARSCAVVFEQLTGEQTASLSAALVTAELKGPPASVLVVWRRAGAGSPLERELIGAGHHPLFATTPLEGAAWLQVPGTRIGTVLVDSSLTKSGDWDFLQFLREQHASLRRLLIVDAVGSFRLNLMLRTGLAEAVLEPPFRAAALGRKLGAGPNAQAPKRPRRKERPE
jgi:hypothetical protein